MCTIGDMKPVGMAIVDVMPKTMPEKFGVLSTILASTPEDTAPWNASESVRKDTARKVLQPA